MALKKKPKKAAAVGGFFEPGARLTGTEIMVRTGKVLGRGGAFLGMSYLANGTPLSTKKVRKWMGPMAILVGAAGEIFLSDLNPGAQLTKGVAEGISTWGVVDTTATFVFPNKKLDFGLAGLGATGSGDEDYTPSGSGVDWAALAQQIESQGGGSTVPAFTMGSIPGASSQEDSASLVAQL